MIEIANLSNENRLSFWFDNLDDVKHIRSIPTQANLLLLKSAFVETKFTKSIDLLQFTPRQTTRTLAWPDNTAMISESKVNEFLDVDVKEEGDVEELSAVENEYKRTTLNVKISMVDVSWTTEATSDGRIRTFGDLMTIFIDAPDEVIETKFLKTLVYSLWNRYFWSIIWCRLVPAFMYLISCLFYYSYFLFDKKGIKGISDDERWTFSFESCFRYLSLLLILYHWIYEVLQIIRFKKDYF